MRLVRLLLAVAVLGVAGLALVRVPWTTQRCNVEKQRAESLIASARNIVSDFDRQRAAAGAAERMERCVAATPHDWQVHFLAGVLHETAGRAPMAMKRYEAALALEERPEIYTSISLLQIQNGEAEAGLRNAEKATEFNLEFADEYEKQLHDQLWARSLARKERLEAQRR